MATRNASNTGRGLESALEGVFGHYEARGLARIKKVDPPVVYARGQMVAKKNPWLDYSGSWCGRSIHIEAKSRTPAKTKKPDDHWLRIRAKTNGLSERQTNELLAWGKSGAVVVIAWELEGHGLRVFDWTTVRDCDAVGINRLYWAEGVDVEETAIGPDILRTLEMQFGGLKKRS